jgi:hypothetical protein
LARYRPIAILYQAALFFVGVLFYLESTLNGEAFTESVYGSLAYSIPAEFWSLAMMLASALCWTGLVKPMMLTRVVAGALIHSVAFATISVSAIFYDGEFAIGVFSSIFFLTANLIITWKAYESR